MTKVSQSLTRCSQELFNDTENIFVTSQLPAFIPFIIGNDWSGFESIIFVLALDHHWSSPGLSSLAFSVRSHDEFLNGRLQREIANFLKIREEVLQCTSESHYPLGDIKA